MPISSKAKTDLRKILALHCYTFFFFFFYRKLKLSIKKLLYLKIKNIKGLDFYLFIFIT
jgi:hypothetical protein